MLTSLSCHSLQINARNTEHKYTLVSQHYIFKKKVNPLGLKKAFSEQLWGQKAEQQIPNAVKADREILLKIMKQKALKIAQLLRYQRFHH